MNWNFLMSFIYLNISLVIIHKINVFIYLYALYTTLAMHTAIVFIDRQKQELIRYHREYLRYAHSTKIPKKNINNLFHIIFTFLTF